MLRLAERRNQHSINTVHKLREFSNSLTFYFRILEQRNIFRLRYAKSIMLFRGGVKTNSTDPQPSHETYLCSDLLPMQDTELTHQPRKFLVNICVGYQVFPLHYLLIDQGKQVSDIKPYSTRERGGGVALTPTQQFLGN